MLRQAPYDKIGQTPTPKYTNADPLSGDKGSIPNAETFNQLQYEGENLVALGGMAGDGTNLFQWTQAISRGGIWAGNLTGTGDLAVATLSIPSNGAVLPALLQGMRVAAVATATNTVTNPKLRVLNLGASPGLYTDFPILKEDGSALAVGEIKAGRRYRYEADGAGNVLISGGGIGSGTGSGAVTVVANQTLYVRTDGNDANDGSANDAGHAFATLSAAISASFRYVTTGNPVVIRLGLASTYAAPGRINLSGRSIQILGDTANQGSYIISGPGASDGTALVQPTNGFLSLSGVTLQNTGNPSSTAIAGLHGALSVSYVTFQTTVSNPHYHLATDGGSLLIGPGCIFASSMGGWLECRGGYGQIDSTGTLTFQGAPAWSTAGIVVADTGVIGLTRTYAPAISGSATGVRFSANNNGVIETWGSGVNLYPGNSAGSTTTGGVYA